ncbi:hypothetical protein NC652_019142 [Populus alba x Populus x berolinensis]|nr:hypothetical protein NC652_019142 [Populus alba x Populus x berolinensis]
MSLCLLHGDATEIFLSFSTLIFVNKETYLSHLEVNVMIPRVKSTSRSNMGLAVGGSMSYPPHHFSRRGDTQPSNVSRILNSG